MIGPWPWKTVEITPTSRSERLIGPVTCSDRVLARQHPISLEPEVLESRPTMQFDGDKETL